MSNFISEDDIERAILSKLEAPPFSYDILRCDPSPEAQERLPDGTGRSSKQQCVLPEILWESLLRLNPGIPPEVLRTEWNSLCQNYAARDMTATNYRLYRKLRDAVKVSVRKNGKEDFTFIRLMDYDNPGNNIFTAVSQMWIRGEVYYRRPDVLIFVNGLPLVFIELKNSIVEVREAYDKNLKDYLRDIPNLFAFNQICVLSNGIETRVGAFSSTYDYFFEWLRVTSEAEHVDRKKLREVAQAGDSSVRYFVDGLLDKGRLLDYVGNFILFQNKRDKIIAKNHQFLGVNNLMASLKRRKELSGKLGVFWHTQGSGKSYSMVFFVRKVRRTMAGNFSFLIVTDRDDLDKQIAKNFIRTETVGEKEECRPKSGAQLRAYLQTNKPLVFTTIQKFTYQKGRKYPVLSERDDLIVLVDEAHRTQYKDLARNMHTGLPNANYVAFTGTPLLGAKRLTNQWFGDYVSEYNFLQSVEDGATVPLFYSKPVPEVCLQNDFLDDDVMEIIEAADLNEDEARLLEDSASRMLEVIRRDDRLDKIAAHIAYHFPRRGFLGKGMVISVDKYTAVRMYDKVQRYWTEEKKKLTEERSRAATKEERDRIKAILDFMNSTEMAVVVSEEADENKKFAEKKLDIRTHREKMNRITPEGEDIEDRFKNPNDPLRLVFVCAMWLTGFDVPSLSTLYLDKPMKRHTLMQAIARANRVFDGKEFGLIIDYVNVFYFMQKALRDYAAGDDGAEYPVKNMEKLVQYLDEATTEAVVFLETLGVNMEQIVSESSTLDQLDALRDAYNVILEQDAAKEKSKVILNTLVNLYEASKPEIFRLNWEREELCKALCYLHGLLQHTIDDEKVYRARLRMEELLDSSVWSVKGVENVKNDFALYGTKVIDLSKVDVEGLKKEFKQAKYKAIEIDDMKSFIENALTQMLRRNCTRRKFSERFRAIIDRYNAGSADNEQYYEELVNLISDMQTEDRRAEAEGLSEAELELYDLLAAGKKLTQEEQQKVKLSARDLYAKLWENHKALMVVDWYKDDQPKARVRSTIEEVLDGSLPDCYDKDLFEMKTNLVFAHLMDMAAQGYGWTATEWGGKIKE